MKRRLYEVTDDSGFMALVDPVGYKGFVASDWKLDQLFRHFKKSIKSRELALWGTGRADIWRVEVRFRRSSDTGFREFSTSVMASSDQLLLTNYESLTMAAQFEDVSLPENHQRDLLIPVTPGVYDVRIIQRLDPESTDPTLRNQKADFVVELVAANVSEDRVEGAPAIPWSRF